MTEYVRPAAVAGAFYPGETRDLQRTVQTLLSEGAEGGLARRPPKAIIAPHAGYVYSGPVAARAYAQVAPLAGIVRRVVLIGPAHRVPVQGVVVPSVRAFATPLGTIVLDREAIDSLSRVPGVSVWDAPHADEHSLEVQLPFLQTILSQFQLVPLLAGDASGDLIADVLEHLWDGPETLIVISSDLSHYLDYAAARRLDSATCRAIEALDGSAISWEQACGRVPLIGLLTLARRRSLAVETLDLRNSGDTAGGKGRVVGYGAWLFTEPDAASGRVLASSDDSVSVGGSGAALLARHGKTLLDTAAASIDHGLRWGDGLAVNASEYPDALQVARASFVTLKANGRLRGCIGSVEAHRPLIEDVAANSFAAAFRDDRFGRLSMEERPGIELSISVLEEPLPLQFEDEAALLAQLRIGQDGLLIRCDGRRGLFLPQVWNMLEDPGDFLRQLKVKAGLPADHWSDDFRAWRFAANTVSSDAAPSQAQWS
jgi:AmmeMemoRadiSam system protein B/AmmeMemoRadiSam system protein A